MDRTCSMNGVKWAACRILVGKPKGKRQLGSQNVRGWAILKWILRDIKLQFNSQNMSAFNYLNTEFIQICIITQF
jgi:hypothetical protein